MISVEFNTGPVSALKIVDDLVLAGVGGHLEVYDVKEQKQFAASSTYVLPCRNIHGIRQKKNSSQFCIFGEKVVRVLQLEENENGIKLRVIPCSEAFLVEDWIWEVTWLSDGLGDEVALAVGHNVILHWRWTSGEILHRLDCVEKCILYSACFINHQWSKLVLAAGTVFNQVVLWSACGQQNDQGECPVLHRLSGHQGVIFAIDYSPSLKLICSASDDRSVRVWQLQSDQDWTVVDSTLLHTLYGHSARVWGVRLFLDGLVSVGEDSLCCVWNSHGVIAETFKGHKGRSIWSLAVSEEKQLIVTGGGDNSIRLWYSRRNEKTDSQTSSSEITFPEHSQIGKSDFVRNVALLDFESVLIISHEGAVYTSHRENSSQCQLVCQSAELKSYSVLAVNNKRNFAAVGSISGAVCLIWTVAGQGRQPSSVAWTQQAVHCGKVLSLAWVDSETLLTTGPDGDMRILRVTRGDCTITMTTEARLSLPACKQRWATAGFLLSSRLHLLCGDRGGTVHWYQLPSNQTGKQPLQPFQSFPRIHGKAGVTDVCCHDNVLVTSGRDGHIRQWAERDSSLHLVSSKKVAKRLEWIGRFVEFDGNLCVAAFCSSQFLLWGLAEDVRLMQVDCGGGHRSWDCHVHDNQACFVFLKARSIIVHQACLRQHQALLKPPLHGRELTDVLHLASVQLNLGHLCHVLATSSEDTTINISALHAWGTKPWTLQTVHTLQGHLSNIRTLSTCSHCSSSSAAQGPQQQTKASSMLLFSGGGRAQLLAWQLSMQDPNGCAVTGTIEDCGYISDTKRTSNSSSSSHTDRNMSGAVTDLDTQTCSGDQAGTTDDFRVVTKEGNNSTAEITENSMSAREKALATADPCMETASPSSQSAIRCSGLMVGGVTLAGHRPPHKGYKPWRTKQLCADPETRVMCLTVFCAQHLVHTAPGGVSFIGAACSDGFLKLFCFQEEEKKFTLLKQSPYHDCCLLKVSHLIHHWELGVDALLLSAATDGKIVFWDIAAACLAFLKDIQHKDGTLTDMEEASISDDDDDTLPEEDGCGQGSENSASDPGASRVCRSVTVQRFPADWTQGGSSEWKPLAEVKVHQSGVNCLHVYHVQGCEYLVASGGDDNALGVCSFTLSSDPGSGVKVSAKKAAERHDAHAAQITGVQVLREDLIFTASIDQRLCLWKMWSDKPDSPSKLLRTACHYTHVSDVANLTQWAPSPGTPGREALIAVCGEGMSVVKVSLTPSTR